MLNKNKEVIYADFSKTKACEFLCQYDLKNEEFKLKNGSTLVKDDVKGIYNPSNLRKIIYQRNQIIRPLIILA